ncbi:putative concanavalin A-like lectin/glucanase domain, legume lectin [Lupinus albus]|uniref:Putative concanavalin A-like lectin/glucanase domain, legume lectin n=1 Tax=Lupinus albus TaxID=3870 RepID=A0A6A4QBX9_LUPAL|nr:putative concanavalin A-like lectin/glucanase domain, legume lectin [Lupinus albus]
MANFFIQQTHSLSTLTINLEGDTIVVTPDALRLTHPITNTTGRALYTSPLHLWEHSTLRVSSFDTNFTFVLSATEYEHEPSDGITFFIAPIDTTIPHDSYGGFLGLFTPENAFNASANQVVAVEFDTFRNPWDPRDIHFSILANTISSETYQNFERRENEIVSARITYTPPLRGESGTLTASYSYPPYTTPASTITLPINLHTVLPQWVSIGFSSSTGDYTQTHIVRTWSFSSQLLSIENTKEENDVYNTVRDV